MSCLNKKYKKGVIVLVDEYDAPLNHAFQKGYYDQASSFLGSFYGKALKGNSALERACLVGIIEFGAAGILSGLNNVGVYSVADSNYQSCFGLCPEEVNAMLASTGRSDLYEQVMDQYNGYKIGTILVINPWSFINCFYNGDFDPYWVQSAFTATISDILRPHLKPSLIDMISVLLAQQRLEISPLKTQVNDTKECNSFGEVWIPNREVRNQWDSDIVNMIQDTFAPEYRDRLFQIFTTPVFDPAVLKQEMQKMLLHTSYHDVNTRNESSYHMFFYGVFFALLHGSDCEVSSNRESGYGRNDIRILFVSMKKCFIFEFKLSYIESALDQDAQSGLQQIIEKKYAADSLSQGYSCIGIGIACFHKKLSELKCQPITE